MEKSIFQAGTSFNKTREREQVFSPIDKLFIKTLNTFFSTLPYVWYHLIYVLKRKLHGMHVPIWFYSTKMEQYSWNDFLDDKRTKDL